MSRAGFRLLLIVLMALVIGFLAGWRANVTFGEQLKVYPYPMRPPVPADLAFIQSPTPIPGLHEYAVPLRAEPVATPEPKQLARPKRVPASVAQRVERQARHHISTHRNLKGVATWHATGRDGWYGAAGPELRRAIGKGWRGTQTLVCSGPRCLVVTLSDWCLCSHGHRLVDLSDEAFRYLAPLSRGVIRVAVGW